MNEIHVKNSNGVVINNAVKKESAAFSVIKIFIATISIIATLTGTIVTIESVSGRSILPINIIETITSFLPTTQETNPPPTATEESIVEPTQEGPTTVDASPGAALIIVEEPGAFEDDSFWRNPNP